MFSPDERLKYVYAFVKYDNKDLELDFWQDEFIKSIARFTCLLKSRRTGYSFSTALKGIVKANDPDRINYTKQFISYNESDALEKIRYAQAFYESIPTNNKKKLITCNKTCLEFQDVGSKTVSRLVSFPCRAPRGKGGDIALDEYGIYLPRISDVIYTAALPVISRGGCLEVGSTPLGKIGKFYEICTDKVKFKDFQRFYIPWWCANALCNDVYNAVREAPSMSTEDRVAKFGAPIIQKIFQNISYDAFKQEYECEFVDEAESYITLDLIYSCVPGQEGYQNSLPENADISLNEYAADSLGKEIQVFRNADDVILNYNPSIHGNPVYMGYDVAKNRDALAIIGIGLLPDGRKKQIFRIEEHNQSFEWQKDTIRKLMKKLPVYRCTLDCTGVGAPIYEELHKEFGDRIEGYQFTLQSKEPLAIGVKTGLERKEFLLENDKEFHRQIHSIKRLPAMGSHFRYDAERSEGSHADSFWALALANYAAGAAIKNVNFYQKYASSKNQKSDIVLLNNSLSQSNNADGSGTKTIRRGKSLESVLRGVK